MKPIDAIHALFIQVDKNTELSFIYDETVSPVNLTIKSDETISDVQETLESVMLFFEENFLHIHKALQGVSFDVSLASGEHETITL